jgi:hypothetical protein
LKYVGIRHEDEYAEGGITVSNPDQHVADELNRAGGLPMHDPWVRGLDWVICGGESGPGARPMHPDWARSLRDQCQAATVPFFFKQWGEWCPGEQVIAARGVCKTATWFDGHWVFDSENLAADEGHIDDEPDVYRVGKHAAGCLLDGREWKEFPEVRLG